MPAQRSDPSGSLRAGAASSLEAALTALRDALDEDGDGFGSPAEAEGHYRRCCELLDDDHDGRRSRAELRPEAPGTPALQIADVALVGAAEQECVADHLRRYDLRVDCTVGRMSTREFDEMVASSHPPIREPAPAIVRLPRRA